MKQPQIVSCAATASPLFFAALSAPLSAQESQPESSSTMMQCGQMQPMMMGGTGN